MNDRVDLPQAREVCPTTTRRMITEGALLVDVRERNEVAPLAFDVRASKGFPIKRTKPAPAAPAGGCCAAPAATSACCDGSAAPAAGGGCCSPTPGATGKCC